MRHRAVLRSNELLPPLRHAPEPSDKLRGHTVSEALRAFPENRPHRLQFAPPRSELGLPPPEMLSSMPHSAYGTRSWLGDEFADGGMRSSYASLRSSNNSSLYRARSTSQLPRRGRGLMISGGAPLRLETQRSLKALQTQIARSFSEMPSPGGHG